jgi:hypothetical protein
MKVRTIGIARAKIKIGLADLAYNTRRLIFHTRTAAAGSELPGEPKRKRRDIPNC